MKTMSEAVNASGGCCGACGGGQHGTAKTDLDRTTRENEPLVTHARYVDTAVARFHYARTGTGPPVLLLPGAGGWRLNTNTRAEFHFVHPRTEVHIRKAPT